MDAKRLNYTEKSDILKGIGFDPKKGRPRKEETNDPAKENKKPGRPKLDILFIANVKEYLKEKGGVMRFNETNRKSETQGIIESNYIAEILPIIIYDELKAKYKCSVSMVADYLKVIMLENAYNPVLEMLNSEKWDGVDRLPELFRIMRIADNDRLSKILVYKWLWQNLSMLRNYKGTFGADGLLVLQGGQGIGKTSFARKMALRNEWFGESLVLDIRNKDTILNAVSCWIGEMGEIESTFKSDINALKGFVSQAMDKIRVPYGRTSEDMPRHTSFIGTCNSDKYLIDETGNRRFWTINIPERMDLDALDKFDALQLYLQIDERAKNDVHGFRLTWEENAQLAERNSNHEKPLKAEMEVRDIIFKADNFDTNSSPLKLVYRNITVSDFKKSHLSLKNYSVEQISRALTKAGVEEGKQTKVEGKNCRLRRLPVWISSSSQDDDLPI